MKDYEILDSVGGVDPGFIEKAGESRPIGKRSVWKAILPAAACLCLAAGCVLLIKAAKKPQSDKTAMNGTETAIPSETAENTALLPESTGGGFGPVYGTELPNGGTDEKHIRTVITYYPRVGSDEHPVMPAGDAVLSPTLRAAMEEYGDKDEYGNDIIYLAALEIFDGIVPVIPCAGKEISPEVEAEIRRLFDEAGIESDVRCYTGGGDKLWSVYISATAEQLRSFPAGSKYGWWIMLGSETFDDHGEPYCPVVFGGN